jgi:hypothetical protein
MGGKVSAAYYREWNRMPRGKWRNHKARAKSRAIPFLLTFEEWWSIWKPHWHERGCGRGKYCMARFGDCGPYAVGNVKIIRNEENRAELVLSHEALAKISSANTGRKNSEVALARMRVVSARRTRDLRGRFKIEGETPAGLEAH